MNGHAVSNGLAIHTPEHGQQSVLVRTRSHVFAIIEFDVDDRTCVCWRMEREWAKFLLWQHAIVLHDVVELVNARAPVRVFFILREDDGSTFVSGKPGDGLGEAQTKDANVATFAAHHVLSRTKRHDIGDSLVIAFFMFNACWDAFTVVANDNVHALALCVIEDDPNVSCACIKRVVNQFTDGIVNGEASIETATKEIS